MKKAVTGIALLLALCLSACTATQYRLTIDEVEKMDAERVESININGMDCDEESGQERFEYLLGELQAMYDGELKGGELKFAVLWWYRTGWGGYFAALPPLGLYHSDKLSIAFFGIAQSSWMTLKEDRDTRELIGFTRYDRYFFCSFGTLENYEFFGDPEQDEPSGILKEYSWMIGPFKLYTIRERVDFDKYEE